MAYIKEYWDDKNALGKRAQKHTEKMERDFKEEIVHSQSGTQVYWLPQNFTSNTSKTDTCDTEIIVENNDSVSAVLKYAGTGKCAVLNFASYKDPGGMFLKGSKAQEECLCHESFLYNVLDRITGFYEWNRENKNKALYLNRAIYSPDIVFFRNDNTVKCDVITCAAPNKSAAQKYCNVSDKENTDALRDRIRFVLEIAKINGVETLILGAYGCGVFGQDAEEVAGIFKEYLSTAYQCFKTVIFAVPKKKDGNLAAFENIFKKEENA